MLAGVDVIHGHDTIHLSTDTIASLHAERLPAADFVLVFVVLLLIFSVTMSFIYPVQPQFRYTVDAMIALWLLATTGEPIEGFPPRFSDMLPTSEWPSVGLWGTPNGVAFFGLFWLWLYLSLILLLNLLIAAMTSSFQAVSDDAGREWLCEWAAELRDQTGRAGPARIGVELG